MRGEGKTSAKYWFLFTIVLQCLACKLVMEGNLDLYVTANTGLLFLLLAGTFLRAASLGTFFAFAKAVSTIFHYILYLVGIPLAPLT